VGAAGDTLRFRGRHRGYTRLSSPVVVERIIELHTASPTLVVSDRFDGDGTHEITVPLQPIGSRAHAADDAFELDTRTQRFRVTWSPREGWTHSVGTGWVSRSYGVKVEAPQLERRRSGALMPLTVRIESIPR
jgi:hypothetical protein